MTLVRVCVIAISVLVASCSSTGHTIDSKIVVPKTVRMATSIHPEIVAYVPEFVDALKAVGLDVGETANPDALELKFEFNPNPFNIRVAASLWQRGLPVLSASATNPGWGTALARGSSVDGRAEAALESFKEQLAELAPRMTIVPDSG